MVSQWGTRVTYPRIFWIPKVMPDLYSCNIHLVLFLKMRAVFFFFNFLGPLFHIINSISSFQLHVLSFSLWRVETTNQAMKSFRAEWWSPVLYLCGPLNYPSQVFILLFECFAFENKQTNKNFFCFVKLKHFLKILVQIWKLWNIFCLSL